VRFPRQLAMITLTEVADALQRRYPYYDPISTLPEAGQTWWANRSR